MENLIITINRENGSGGRYIGELLAKKLNIKCYNNELLTELSKITKEDQKTLKGKDEIKEKGRMFFAVIETNTKRFETQSKIIKDLSKDKSCIIIGRCADFILKDHPNKISIFLHAPLGSRIERITRRKEKTIINAEKEITKEDKSRANYYNYYTGQNWSDIRSYDLTIDTSKTGLDGAVTIIENYIKIRQEKQENHEKNVIK